MGRLQGIGHCSLRARKPVYLSTKSGHGQIWVDNLENTALRRSRGAVVGRYTRRPPGAPLAGGGRPSAPTAMETAPTTIPGAGRGLKARDSHGRQRYAHRTTDRAPDRTARGTRDRGASTHAELRTASANTADVTCPGAMLTCTATPPGWTATANGFDFRFPTWSCGLARC